MAVVTGERGSRELELAAMWDLADGCAAGTCVVDGPVRSRRFAPVSVAVWQMAVELGSGATVIWGEDHGDEAVYVVMGEVEVGGRVVTGPGAVVVESRAPATFRCRTDVRLLHCGSGTPEVPTTGPFGPAASDGHDVHVVDEAGASGVRTDDRTLLYYVDGTCATCRPMLFTNFQHEAWDGPSHLHSQDEIIHVLSGELRVGRQVVAAGTSVAIPAGRRYRFRNPGPCTFLNYRPDASIITLGPGTEPWLERPREAVGERP